MQLSLVMKLLPSLRGASETSDAAIHYLNYFITSFCHPRSNRGSRFFISGFLLSQE
jgi:hypothetical protein